MRKIKLTLEYDGTAYAGWQLQGKGDTIQARVEAALGGVLQERVRLHGAGRTDAGAHALGQVAHFETKSVLVPERIRAGVNACLPRDIAVIAAEEADPSFHARFSARGKVYRYLVFPRKVASPFWRARACHFPARLNLQAMREAAARLIGSRDFSAFTAAGSSVKDRTRLLSRLEISRRGELFIFELEATGFLYKMVRNIVGTLLLVGAGKMSPAEMKEILSSRSRARAGPTAPACGLYLVRVLYS